MSNAIAIGNVDFGGSVFTLALGLVLWFLYTAFYRLVLSPIAAVPGPKLAALTTMYAAYYDVFYPAQYVFKVKELHKKYGNIIRIGPEEVHVNDVEFLDPIYNPPSRKRNKYMPNMQGLPLDRSVGSAEHWDVHRKRRDALSPFFSHKKVLDTETLIQEKVQEFCHTIDEFVGSERVLNLSDLNFALALDIVRKYSFGQDQDVLAHLDEANRLRNNLGQLLRSTKFNLYFGWVLGVTKLLPKSMTDSLVPPGVSDLINFRKVIRHDLEEIFADSENTLKGPVNSVFYGLKDNSDLPDDERTIDRLEEEGSLLIMAGTESTAKSMQIAHYHLLANPSIMSHLRDELSKAGNPTTLKALEQLPYLSAVIYEANRLSFGLTFRNTRVAPEPEVLQYKQYALPPGTAVSMSTLCIHTNEDIFPDPWTFNPDRFLGREGLDRRKYMMSMGRGTHKCIGINLANAEMCMAIAAVARYEMELFETDEDDVKFLHDYHVSHPRLGSKGVRAKVVSKV
ncbi:cytochrome P450 [Lophiostoma macrostomum CBS 122681]|uniref:Cytochrome P450 n=1 Tax=Lophiostoma macrostomum CBS 122681 TaxID=1314788 RepID=A0A6A6SNI5_9PLEO|nr:cytochrome P450 [Lophiostoma macrostomum CBS 122681]